MFLSEKKKECFIFLKKHTVSTQFSYWKHIKLLFQEKGRNIFIRRYWFYVKKEVRLALIYQPYIINPK